MAPGIEVTLDRSPLEIVLKARSSAGLVEGSVDSLTARERALLSQMGSPQRRSEFIESRRLLRHRLPGNHDFVPDKIGRPQWPAGVRGSISHKIGHIAVALSSDSQVQGVGIDLEKCDSVSTKLVDKICVASEQQNLPDFRRAFQVTINAACERYGSSDACGSSRVQQDEESRATSVHEQLSVLASIFSAKECLYKLVYPLAGVQFYFHDAVVETLSSKKDHVVLGMRLLKNLGGLFDTKMIFEVRCEVLSFEDGLFVLSSAYLDSA